MRDGCADSFADQEAAACWDFVESFQVLIDFMATPLASVLIMLIAFYSMIFRS
jgi:hypothetical protein